MFTPVPSHNRRLSEPITIDGVTFPAETVVDILPWCLHHHPDVWENHMVYIDLLKQFYGVTGRGSRDN